MIDVSNTFLAALRGPHQLAVRAVAYPPAGGTVDLPILDGSVTIDRTADQRRRLDLTIAPKYPAGHEFEGEDVYPATTSGAVNVYGTEVKVYRGIEFAGGAAEYAALGVFRVEDAQRDLPGGAVQITGWDRSKQVADERFLKPRKCSAQDATTLIQTLISEVYPAATFADSTGDSTNIPKHVVDRDRWAECQRLAQVIGAEVFPDADGGWVIQDVPDPASASPVWAVDAGEGGVLVSISDSVTREGAPSVVVAIGESKDGNQAPVHSVLPHGYDDDATSPTYYLGSYGTVPRFYSSPHIKTQAQANRVADAQLADHVGVTRSISFQAVPNPALEAGDAVTVTRPDGTSEIHLLDVVTISLGPGGAMSAETRAKDWNAE